MSTFLNIIKGILLILLGFVIALLLPLDTQQKKYSYTSRQIIDAYEDIEDAIIDKWLELVRFIRLYF